MSSTCHREWKRTYCGYQNGKFSPIEFYLKFSDIIFVMMIAEAVYIGYENFFVHLFSLLQQPTQESEVRSFSDPLSPLPNSNDPLSVWIKWEEQLIDSLCQTLRIQKSTLTATDKQKFLEFWKQNH